jgi:hypothetical protein
MTPADAALHVTGLANTFMGEFQEAWQALPGRID